MRLPGDAARCIAQPVKARVVDATAMGDTARVAAARTAGSSRLAAEASIARSPSPDCCTAGSTLKQRYSLIVYKGKVGRSWLVLPSLVSTAADPIADAQLASWQNETPILWNARNRWQPCKPDYPVE